MSWLHLYARVAFSFCAFAHETAVCQPAPGFPCALCLSEGETETQSSGAIAPRDADAREACCLTVEYELRWQHERSLPGLTRQSIAREAQFASWMDARVKARA